MNGPSRPLTRPWMPLVGAVILIAAHALVRRYALPHKGLSSAVVAGVMIFVVIKHLGFLRHLYAMFPRRSGRADGGRGDG
jgi:hypothetical protein